MDAAAQLVYCGPFTSAASSKKLRRRRFFPRITQNAVVKAIATEPRPSDPKQPKVVNGSSKAASFKPVKGALTRMPDVSQENKSECTNARCFSRI